MLGVTLRRTIIPSKGEASWLERRIGLVSSALDSTSSSPGSSPGQEYCVVFLGKTFYPLSVFLHSVGVYMRTGECIVSSPVIIRVVTQRFSPTNGRLNPNLIYFSGLANHKHPSHIPEAVAPRLIVQSQLKFYRLCRHLFNYLMLLTIIMLQPFAMEHHESRHRAPEHFIRDENKCTDIFLSLHLF